MFVLHKSPAIPNNFSLCTSWNIGIRNINECILDIVRICLNFSIFLSRTALFFKRNYLYLILSH